MAATTVRGGLGCAAVEWLGDLGVEFYDQMVFGGDETVPRVHCPIGRGQAVVDELYARCREAGVEFALGQRIDRLLVSDGAVHGVAVGDDEITSGAVVVASGGFGANDEPRVACGVSRVPFPRRVSHLTAVPAPRFMSG